MRAPRALTSLKNKITEITPPPVNDEVLSEGYEWKRHHLGLRCGDVNHYVIEQALTRTISINMYDLGQMRVPIDLGRDGRVV